MKLIHKYDPKTKLFIGDEFLSPEPKADPSDPDIWKLPTGTVTPQPVGFHTPKWDGTKWVEGDKPAAAALKVEIKKHDDDEKALKKDHDDAKTDNDDTAAGISRRVARLERILNLK